MVGTIKIIVMIAILIIASLAMMVAFNAMTLDAMLASMRFLVPAIAVAIASTLAIGWLTKTAPSEQKN